MKKFSVTIISPERMLFKGDASEVMIPAQEGCMSILSNHAPLLATLRDGKVKIISDSPQKEFDIREGFVEVSKKKTSFVNIFVRQS